jgi:hypothetical protein
MAGLLPENEAALPVFKVLYRNTQRIGEHGGRDAEVLHAVAQAASVTSGRPGVAEFLAALKAKDVVLAERFLEDCTTRDTAAAFNTLLHLVQENVEVHRTVLPYRAWEMIDLVGTEYASILLRQSLRYCLDAENQRQAGWSAHGKVLATLLESHHLLGREPGTKKGDDAFIEDLSRTIFQSSPEEAAGAVASALAEGFLPSIIGEALSLAASEIVLRDPGRIPAWEFPGKVVGSVHGDSIGVHASDSANAWRNLARVSSGRNTYACLILGAWQVARDRGARSGLIDAEPVPSKRQLSAIKNSEEAVLLDQLDEAVQDNMQAHAAAIVRRYADLGLPEGPVFDRLLRYAISEDGALHAEKYFQTVRDDFYSTRPAFRWHHLIALARVTASEYGYAAAGQEEARALLGIG